MSHWIDVGHDPVTTPWNSNQNRLETPIQINQKLKPKTKKKNIQ